MRDRGHPARTRHADVDLRKGWEAARPSHHIDVIPAFGWAGDDRVLSCMNSSG
jgi:hypothetical protein